MPLPTQFSNSITAYHAMNILHYVYCVYNGMLYQEAIAIKTTLKNAKEAPHIYIENNSNNKS